MTSLCAHGATLTWTGAAGDGLTATAANWSPAQAPVAGDILIFSGTTSLAPRLATNLSVGSISFNSGSGAFVLGGAGVYTVGTGGIANNGATLETIGNSLILGASQTWNAGSGALTMTGGVSLAAGRVLTATGSFNTRLQGVVSDTGAITKTGTGSLTLTGINTYTGNTTLSAGTLVIGNNAAFGTGNLILQGGTLQGDAARTLANAITLNGNTIIGGATALTLNGQMVQSGGSRTLTVNNTAATTFAGGIQLTNAGTARTLTITGTGNVVMSGAITDGVAAGTVSKTGTGTLTLSGASSHTGGTRVSAGTLVLSNNSAAGLGLLTLGGGALQSGLAGLTLANNVSLAANTTISGTRDVTFNGTFTNTAGSRTLTVTNTALTTITGPVDLSSNSTARTLTIAGTGNLTINSVIRNGSTATTGNFTMSGTGAATLTLGGSAGNTFAGTTTVNDGTLVLAKTAGNAIAGNLTIGSGTGTDTVRLLGSDQIGNTSAVTVNATGVLNVNGNRDTIGSLAGAGAVQLGTGGVLTVGARNVATTYSGVMSGAGSLVKTGTAALTISGTNTFTGATRIEAGTLTLGKAGAIAAASPVTVTGSTSILNLGAFANSFSSLTLEAGTTTGTGLLTLTGDLTATSIGGTAATMAGPVALSGARTLNVNAGGATADLTITGAISSTGNLIKAGDGVLTLSGTNTYSGGTLINAGTLRLTSGTAIADTTTVTLADAAGASLVIVSAGETIGSLAGGGTTGGNVVLGTGALVISGTASNTYAGAISGAGGITKAGTGTLTLAGNNVYAGATTINAGTLRATGGSAISDASAVVTANVSGAVLDLAGSNETIGSIAGGGTAGGGVTLGLGTLSVGANNTSTSYAGIISGTGGVTKVGTGTLTLTTGQTFSGVLTVNGGTLALAGTTGAAASASGINLGTGGTLRLDNSVTENASRIASGATITLNGGTLHLISDATGTTENFGTLVPTSGASNITITHNGSAATASVIRFGSLGAVSSGATVNFGATSGTLGVAATGPQIYITGQASGFIGGWATVGANFAEYSTFGVRALLGYFTGPIGVNVNDPAEIVLLASSSPASAYTLTNIGTTTDKGLSLTDAPLLDMGTSSGNVLNLVSGGLLKSTAVNTTVSGQGRLTANGTASGNLSVTVTATGSLTIASPIIDNAGVDGTYGNGDDGVVSLSKAGPGTLILSGINSFTGNVLINEGTVQVGAEANLGSSGSDVVFNNGALNVVAGFSASADKVFRVGAGLNGTLDIASGATLTLGNAANVLVTADTAGTLFKKGAGTLVIQNANANFDGKLQIDAGVVELRDAQALGDATNRGTITLNGGSLNLRGDTELNFGNAVTVLADSTIDAARLSGSSPAVALTLGTLAIGANTVNVTGANGSSVGFGAVVLSGNATINTTTADASVGSISGVFGLTKTGSGVLTVSGVSTLSGTTNVNAGTLRFGAANTSLANSGIVLSSGAVFDLNDFSGIVGSISGSGDVSLGSGSLEVGLDSTSTTFSGTISGAGGLIKDGSGTFTLAGANTYTGTTMVNAGTLRISAAERIADVSALNVGGSGIFDLNSFNETVSALTGSGRVILGSAILTVANSGANGTFSGILSGTGGLTKSGSATLVLAGPNTYTGQTTVAGGVLELQNASALGDPAGIVVVNAGGELRFNGDLDIGAESLRLSGTGVSGGGALHSLRGSTSWAGNLMLLADATIGADAGTLTVGGAIAKGANLLTSAGSGNVTVTGAIAGSGSAGIAKVGGGTLLLSAANTYTGTTDITAGVVSVQNAAALGAVGSGNGTTVASGAAVEISNDIGIAVGAEALTLNGDGIGSRGALRSVVGVNSWAGAVTFATNTTIGVDDDSLTLSGSIAESGGARSLTKVGAGLLILNGSAAYSGATRINAGTLEIGASDRIHDASAVTIAAGASLDLNDFNETIGSLAGAGSVALGDVVGGTLTMGGDNSTTSYAGVITGLGSVAKTGSGTLTLSGANLFTGTFSILGGTVAVNTNAALGAGSGLIFDGGTLRVTNSLTISRAVNLLAAGGTVDTNGLTVTLAGNIDGAGSVTQNGAGVLMLSGTNSFSGDTTIGSGTLRIGNAAAIPAGVGKGNVVNNGTIDLNGFSITVNGLTGSGAITNGQATAATLTVGANDQDSIVDGAIQNGIGAVALTKIGAGALTLNQANSYSGNTTIVGGTIRLGTGVSLPSGTGKGNLLVDGTLDLRGNTTTVNGLSGAGLITSSTSGALTFTVGANNQTSSFTGMIEDGAGTVALAKTGTGTLTLGDANSYSGSTAVRGGVLAIGSDAGLGTAPSSFVAGSLSLDGGTLSLLNSMTLHETRGMAVGPSVGSGSGTLNIVPTASVIYAGVIANNSAGSGGLVIQGGGSLELGGANTYSGDTVLSGSTLVAGNAAAIPFGAGKGDFVNNGTLDLNGYSATVNAISGTGRVTNNQFATIVTFNAGGNNRTSSFGGTIDDGSGLTSLNKIGSGVLTVSGANSYSGSTTVSGGTLAVSGSLSATSGISVAANATFQLNGTVNALSNSTVSGTFAGAGSLGNLTVNSGGVLAPGISTPGILNVGTLTLSSGSRLSMDIGGTLAGVGFDQIRASGAVTLGGASLQLSLTDGYRPVSGSRYLLVSNGSSSGLLGTFSGLPNNSTVNLRNNLGTFPFSLRYSDYDGNGTNDVFLAMGDTKKQLSWATTGANPLQGTLDPSLIPTNTTTAGLRYTNVNEQGYDIVVITKGLNKDGGASYDGNGAWWLEGGTASSGGKAIPYSTVTFRFYLTGTNTPIGLTGIQTTFQDAEAGEQFRAFGYWNASGTSVAGSFTDNQIFTYSSGSPIVHLSDASVENGAQQQAGTQGGKWIGMDLSLNAISGFTFQLGRYNPSAGSVIMTALGADLVPTTELIIKSGSVLNVSAGPNFVAGDVNATLTPAAITSALTTSAASIVGGAAQNIVVNESITSSAGNALSMRATGNLLTAAGVSINLASTTRSAGALTLNADGTVRTGRLDASSTAGSGGAITLTAGRSIAVSGGIDSSSNFAAGRGGAINLQAAESISVDTLRAGGGGSLTRLGAAGDIAVTAGSAISVASLYANSSSNPAVRTTLTAPVINLGAADVEGTLTVQKPASSAAATIAFNGVIQGSANLVIDAGTGVAALNARADHTGQTRVASGTLSLNGKSMAASDLILEGTSAVTPNVTTPGGAAVVKSLTMGTTTNFAARVSSATTYDQLQMSGSANLGGTFKLTLGGGYVPDMGTSFSIMNFASTSGAFRSYYGLRLADRVLVPVFNGTSMSLLTSAIASGASQPLQVVPTGGLSLSAGDFYDGLTAVNSGSGFIRRATIIDGVASGSTLLTMSLTTVATGFESAPTFNSTTLDLHGTGTDKFVLQLDYDEAAVLAAGLDESQLSLGWADSNGQFVNAVMGNTDLPGEANAPQRFTGAYDAQTQFHLGYYGVDTVNDRLWAVLDHNSTYGFTQTQSVPEPTTAVSLLGGLALLGLRRRRAARLS